MWQQNHEEKWVSSRQTDTQMLCLRSAYLSLKRNLPYLFVFQDYKELNMPNTTNALDGQFADLKNKLRNHNVLSKALKIRFIDEFFKA